MRAICVCVRHYYVFICVCICVCVRVFQVFQLVLSEIHTHVVPLHLSRVSLFSLPPRSKFVRVHTFGRHLTSIHQLILLVPRDGAASGWWQWEIICHRPLFSARPPSCDISLDSSSTSLFRNPRRSRLSCYVVYLPLRSPLKSTLPTRNFPPPTTQKDLLSKINNVETRLSFALLSSLCHS